MVDVPPQPYRWSVAPIDAWRLMAEPMSHEEARAACAPMTTAVPHVHAAPADPRKFLVLTWDRRTAEMFIEALTTLQAAGRPVPQHMIDHLQEWLSRADPYGPYDAAWPLAVEADELVEDHWDEDDQ